ncbi:Outer membrane protein beta-barrel domain-containing protein [Hymenobacter gelipurpurascens]|uniref:Outer membrane protein beta-barrel domain-containing protein n=1 Tax=Hymenobacter gelipurpurascens TaxID=89968 RepID=A0A212UGW1_9BACT|nr:porin family protein [Hymenobacter gelipurpurascens]SNC77499.1 Outer membrane protein beta-barrel domain-containing protein [Hymenobacter gelipurpurascens]
MKNIAFATGALLAAATLVSSSAHAQGIRLGIKGGANLSNLSGDLTDEDRFENKLGFHGGVMLNIGLLDDGFLSLQPEVLFSQKGFQYADNEFNIGNNTIKYEGDRTYNYIDVPVLLKINAGGLFFEAGPQYSYLLKVKDESKVSVNGNTATQRSGTSDLDNVNRNEIGYAAGLGYQSDMGLLLGLRYNGSFTDFGKDGYQDNDVRNARNSVFQLSLGYLIPGK